MRVLWRLAAWLINGPLPIRHFDFMFPEPDYARDYASVFPGTRRFLQPTSGFWFDAQVLQTPVSRDEQALRAFLPDAFAQILLPPRGFGPVSQEVRNCLLRQYPDWPDLPAVAESLHVSPATLQRQLARHRHRTPDHVAHRPHPACHGAGLQRQRHLPARLQEMDGKDLRRIPRYFFSSRSIRAAALARSRAGSE